MHFDDLQYTHYPLHSVLFFCPITKWTINEFLYGIFQRDRQRSPVSIKFSQPALMSCIVSNTWKCDSHMRGYPARVSGSSCSFEAICICIDCNPYSLEWVDPGLFTRQLCENCAGVVTSLVRSIHNLHNGRCAPETHIIALLNQRLNASMRRATFTHSNGAFLRLCSTKRSDIPLPCPYNIGYWGRIILKGPISATGHFSLNNAYR